MITKTEAIELVQKAYGFLDWEKEFFTVCPVDDDTFMLVNPEGSVAVNYKLTNVVVDGSLVTFENEYGTPETLTQVTPISR